MVALFIPICTTAVMHLLVLHYSYTHLAKIHNIPVSRLRAKFPNYIISKNKIELTRDINVDKVLDEIKKKV